MSRLKIIIRTRGFKIALTIFFLALSIMYGIISNTKKEAILKDSQLVTARIVDIQPARNGATIYVQYIFNGTVIKNDFSVMQDSFKVKETVLLKVSKKYPDKYIEFIRKVHN